jgi:hypothetical protein
VQRSSETIGAIAAALAKAQAQLVNPEKSLVGTIRSDQWSGAERSFRYAPLSSGLDIVRKTLSQHAIATVQTTGIDERAGIVRLSTVLAHASGEWIASDWPVCAISETADRMGAALTYARRYALFTLVGIAGDDDIDAPDLNAPTAAAASAPNEPMPARNRRLNGGLSQYSPPQQYPRDRNISERRAIAHPSPVTLGPEASGALRDRLAGELKGIGSSDEAATWAHRVLAAKGTLVTADAERIEAAFQQKLAEFKSASQVGKQRKVKSRKLARRYDTPEIDKSELSHPEPRRVRDRGHVRFVTKQPCLVCGRTPSDPHHLRFAQHRAMGRKVSDEFTVPLCRGHHREVHRCGDEAAWWQKIGMDPAAAARALWLKTHPLPDRPKIASTEGVLAEPAADPALSSADAGRSPAARGTDDETNPICSATPR